MSKTVINAQIVAHSVLAKDKSKEVISVLATFPRFILAEVNTHRMLCKNTSSSRAIPALKMIEIVKNDPVIPIAWQKNHSGMQGTEYITNPSSIEFRNLQWLSARDKMVQAAESMNQSFLREDGEGVTKQLTNRLLEPFMWTTMLLTGSREAWENFFYLRCPQYEGRNMQYFKSKKELVKDIVDNTEIFEPRSVDYLSDLEWLQINKGQGEIHIMDLAEKIYDELNESTPKELQPGEWHIPFGDKINIDELYKSINTGVIDKRGFSKEMLKVKVSTSMAARTSYSTVGGDKAPTMMKHLELHDRLLSQDPPHSSPLEHTCMASSKEDKKYFSLTGFIPYRYFIDNKLQISENV